MKLRELLESKEILSNPKPLSILKAFPKVNIKILANNKTKEIFVADANEITHINIAKKVLKKGNFYELASELEKSKYLSNELTYMKATKKRKEGYFIPYSMKGEKWKWVLKYLPIW